MSYRKGVWKTTPHSVFSLFLIVLSVAFVRQDLFPSTPPPQTAASFSLPLSILMRQNLKCTR